jgi:hypothetical protein
MNRCSFIIFISSTGLCCFEACSPYASSLAQFDGSKDKEQSTLSDFQGPRAFLRFTINTIVAKAEFHTYVCHRTDGLLNLSTVAKPESLSWKCMRSLLHLDEEVRKGFEVALPHAHPLAIESEIRRTESLLLNDVIHQDLEPNHPTTWYPSPRLCDTQRNS